MDKKLQDILEELIKNAVLEHDINGMALISMPKKSIAQAISAIKGLVPSEESEYTPPTFTSSANLLPKDYVEGWNNCREEMLRRIK